MVKHAVTVAPALKQRRPSSTLKTVFCLLKGRQWHAKRPSMALPKTVFRKSLDISALRMQAHKTCYMAACGEAAIDICFI